MKAVYSARLRIPYICAAGALTALAVAWVYFPAMQSYAAEQSLLSGKVTSSRGEALAAIPLRAHRDGSTITVSVYTNAKGEYSFPAWSDLSPGTYSVAIALPDFEPVNREGVALASGKTARLNLTLQPRQPSITDATASEIAMAEPGTDEQRFLLTQCSNCHTLQWALRTARTREDWLRIVKRMSGANSPSSLATGSSYFGTKRYAEKLADYLASIRGPGSSDAIPFKLRPRPATNAATRLVVTEYDLPRGGSRELYMLRGDPRFDWTHDVIMNATYAYYTDHYHPVLGRVDKKTGEVKEFTYTKTSQRRALAPDQERAGFQEGAGGTRDLRFDRDGNIILEGFKFNTKTEQFEPFPLGRGLVGIDPAGRYWSLNRQTGVMQMLDPKTGEIRKYETPPIPETEIIYDSAVDSQSRTMLLHLGGGTISMFDPNTEKNSSYQPPTPFSGPRRGDVDANDRYWFGMYWSGRLGMFDPNKGEVKEFALVPDSKPFGPPFPAPYTASVDDKNQIVWASDFNSGRLFRFDIKTERTTELSMPLPYEVRDLTVDKTTERPTVWVPAYRPPSKLVKVQMY